MVKIEKQENNLEDALISNYIVNNYVFPLTNLQINKNINLNELLLKKYENLKSYFLRNNHENFNYYRNEEFFLIIKEYKDFNELNIYSKRLENLEEIFNIFKSLIYIDNENKIYLHKLYYNNKGFLIKKKEINPYTIEYITEDYYPYISNLNNFFENYTISNEQLIFINGEIGTGKTKFSTLYIKYLYEFKNKELHIINVDSNEILLKDEFWLYLEDKDIDLIVLDDIDGIETNKDFVSRLLNFTDGIIKTKTKFIISGAHINFNNLNKGFRDNRVFKYLTFRDLSNEEAKNIWLKNDLDLNEFTKIFTKEKIKKSYLSKIIYEKKYLNKKYQITENIEKNSILKKTIGFNN